VKKIKKLSKKIIKHPSFQNFLIMGGIAFIQAVNNIILGRYLTKEQYGQYSFVFLNVILVLSFFVLIGQNTAIVRYFSAKKLEEYNWKKYIRKFYVYMIVPIIAISYGIKMYYGFSNTIFLYIVAGTLSWTACNLIAAFLRSRKAFNSAILLERANPIFFLVLLSILLLTHNVSFSAVLITKLLSLGMVLPVVIYFFLKWKNGEKTVENRIIKDGFRLWEIGLTMLLLSRIDTFFIPKILNFAELGLFSIMLAVMQLYDFSSSSLWNIYAQKFSENAAFRYKKVIFISCIVGVALTAFYLPTTKFILSILFKGKYNPSFSLVLLFCILGFLKHVYIVPSCFIVGHSTKQEMAIFFRLNLISLGIKFAIIAVYYYFLKRCSLQVFLFSSICAYLFRICIGYGLMIKRKKVSYAN